MLIWRSVNNNVCEVSYSDCGHNYVLEIVKYTGAYICFVYEVENGHRYCVRFHNLQSDDTMEFAQDYFERYFTTNGFLYFKEDKA